MRLAFPAVALSSLLALVGCTTSTGHSAAPHKPTKSTASTVAHPKPRKLTTGPGVTQTDITLGALVDYSGPFADESIAVLHGQQIWINDTNAAGGVCGRKIKLEVRDDRGDTT